jgi:hypothetical protein
LNRPDSNLTRLLRRSHVRPRVDRGIAELLSPWPAALPGRRVQAVRILLIAVAAKAGIA